MNAAAAARPKTIVAKFWKATPEGSEPVRDWLQGMASGDRKEIGGDLMRVEMEGLAVGMPLVRPMGGGLFEVRSNLDRRIARVLFGVDDRKMVLLHGFIKTSRKTPKQDLDLAKERWAHWKKAKR